ncbi:flavin reductase family protein [Megalodesulfovibrio gigas]|uniref:Putative flavin reductase domain-containing FMN-binding protein n=1 Tax=Megalodesulfovibrio gigas (strain ATCC 19364 / DSM 1382 / NCIMB 9332 / VKM B-1759) TaxID=1121448 RepID=T2GA57_MEGG1|nr:flavin reductase family protein [Megalodesulfovibrio gigas]AGW13011.1 putative flavin reductase domain-containing FMN-binding protein [Megalodesulfovibrio gigas DSM 1382 = ATCC 19364]
MRTRLGGVNALYPTPTVLVGAMVNGRPNFNTIAHIGILNYGPGAEGARELISVAMARRHFTPQGIREHGQFSINVPSEDLIRETDFCGVVSGAKEDKSSLFTLFYGELPAAPMIEECPVCMECQLVDTYEVKGYHVFIGEIVETHAREDALTDGKLDLSKIRPLLFDMSSRKYWGLRPEPVGDCWRIGVGLKKERQGK